MFINTLATPHSVQKDKLEKTSHIKRENFYIRKEYLQKNKQGTSKDQLHSLAAITTNNMVDAVQNAMNKDLDILQFEDKHGIDDLELGFFSDSATFDGMGRNIDAFAFISVSPTQKLRIHIFNMFQGADSRQNCAITLHEQQVLLQRLTGMSINVNGIERKLKVNITSDFKALNTMVGRQLGRPNSVSLHITANLEDLSPASHKVLKNMFNNEDRFFKMIQNHENKIYSKA